MGHIEDDGSMQVPVDCIIEAAYSLGSQSLADAAESLRSAEILSPTFQSVGILSKT